MLEWELLVIGVGNELASDDGIGVAAARELLRGNLPAWVYVVEGGTALARCVPLIAASRHLIWVDAVDAGGPPGSIYRVSEAWLSETPALSRSGSSHGSSLAAALAEARILGRGMPKDATLIGMQPYVLGDGYGISDGAAAALSTLVAAVRAEIIRTTGSGAGRTSSR